jgi:hypothetical protein
VCASENKIQTVRQEKEEIINKKNNNINIETILFEQIELNANIVNRP